ncbi:hypothetical protein SH1V18_04810 [Vallitalea longa]|uniref:Uncharacterized protein n=1 Tax=Vallitalea longa TaxID=2936439 RepID=A0A9W5Y8U4_9FIRM|nr:hypothetical protein [Vallitalea longa]GKX28001.1 hypothetical protein SH1V18_04810 [Vallitalea longa]
MGFISKLKDILKKQVVEDIHEKNYLGVNIEDIYDNVENTYELCNRLRNSSNDKKHIIKEYESITNMYSNVQKIEKLNKNQLAEFENFATNYHKIKKDKVDYVDRIKGAGQQFDYLGEYDENIDDVIDNIKNVEERQRDVKTDITYLEGEKGDIAFNRERLMKAQKYVKIFMIAILTIFAFSALTLSILYTYNDIDIFIPSIIMIVVIAFFGSWIFIFRRYVTHELKKNNLLANRAVELINKIKLKYVNNQQFLTYEYNKYKVKSSEMLEDRWSKYKQNKKDKTNIHKLSSNIIMMEDDIERILKKSNIEGINYVLENIDLYSTKEKRLDFMRLAKENQETLKNTIDEYSKEIDVITKILIDVRENDSTNEKIITKMINDVLG